MLTSPSLVVSSLIGFTMKYLVVYNLLGYFPVFGLGIILLLLFILLLLVMFYAYFLH